MWEFLASVWTYSYLFSRRSRNHSTQFSVTLLSLDVTNLYHVNFLKIVHVKIIIITIGADGLLPRC